MKIDYAVAVSEIVRAMVHDLENINEDDAPYSTTGFGTSSGIKFSWGGGEVLLIHQCDSEYLPEAIVAVVHRDDDSLQSHNLLPVAVAAIRKAEACVKKPWIINRVYGYVVRMTDGNDVGGWRPFVQFSDALLFMTRMAEDEANAKVQIERVVDADYWQELTRFGF